MKYLINIILLLSSIAQASLTDELHNQVSLSHKPLTYQQVKIILFSDVDNINNENCSVYTPSECKKRSGKAKGFSLNVEHTWPQSKGSKAFPAVSDMHHLFIASKESNGKRANYPFCNVYDIDWEKDQSILGHDQNDEECFEPRDSHKGNVARAMFYFSIRYQKSLDDQQEKILRLWNLLDPVDTAEYERNQKIQALQGNLNPFIVDPDFINLILDF